MIAVVREEAEDEASPPHAGAEEEGAAAAAEAGGAPSLQVSLHSQASASGVSERASSASAASASTAASSSLSVNLLPHIHLQGRVCFADGPAVGPVAALNGSVLCVRMEGGGRFHVVIHAPSRLQVKPAGPHSLLSSPCSPLLALLSLLSLRLDTSFPPPPPLGCR